MHHPRLPHHGNNKMSSKQQILIVTFIIVGSLILLLHSQFNNGKIGEKSLPPLKKVSGELPASFASNGDAQANSETDEKENSPTNGKISNAILVAPEFSVSPSSILSKDKFTEPFRPPSIEAQLKKHFEEHSKLSIEKKHQNTENENSAPVTQEDLDYASANWVHPFEPITNEQEQSICDEKFSSATRRTPNNAKGLCSTLISVWKTIENYIAKRTNSNAPVITFLDPSSKSEANHVLPLCYHHANVNATLLSVSENHDTRRNRLLGKYKRIFSFLPPSSASTTSSTSNSKFGDWMFDRQPASKTFGSFFTTCNFVAQTMIFDESLLLPSPSPSSPLHHNDDQQQRQRRLSAIFSSLPMSLHVFALLKPSEVHDVEHSIDEHTGEVRHPPDGLQNLWEGTVQKLRIKIDKLGTLCPANKGNHHQDTKHGNTDEDHHHEEEVVIVKKKVSSAGNNNNNNNEADNDHTLTDASGCLEIISIHVIETERACAKTWGAPLIQWGRKLIARRTIEGEISFQVQAVSASAKGTGRKVHPLQYIPSINLDTLLGAGLSLPSRIRLLGDMIKTPRYSDPLPHNWVVGHGGQAIRIDRVDHRYDRDVDESKGYWGRSTRGYLHLLGHHLCLKTHLKTGLPAVMMVSSSSCASVCEKECAEKCSYTKKGQIPCDACLKCGECVEERASGAVNKNDDVLDQLSDRAGSWCHVEYSSMTSARKKWKEWEKADRKHGHSV